MNVKRLAHALEPRCLFVPAVPKNIAASLLHPEAAA
jgi:hypothetical protein